MKTIEQLMQPIIKTDIQYLLDRENTVNKYNLLLTNNFNIQSKNNDQYDIQAITQAGQGTLTQIPGAKAVQTPFQIIFQIPVNYGDRFIKILNTYILAVNAVWSEVTDDLDDDDTATEETYQYRLVWRSPIISGSPYDIQVKSEQYESESISVVQIVLSGDVTHTSTFKMDDEELYLKMGAMTEYEKIIGITSEAEPLSPTINQTNLMEVYNTKKDVNGDSQNLQVTVAVQLTNPLHEKLMRLYYDDRTSDSFDGQLKRIRKSLNINQEGINVLINLNRYKQNGFEYLQINLVRK